ncbi:SDR family oxidoreductase [Nocardioides convexus]|uniref:SDR family oxidoreductase n=1 Tax=Nocardioides convexus TaxID=2712224 RepID=UPI00241844C6|nr:SDR family oxidoreductase [Nocardioides convexus]
MVNNAGATYRFAPLVDTPAEEVRRTIDVNLTAPLLVARAAVAALGSGGVIVNITSGAATLGSPGEYVHYAAAKAGLDLVTRGLGLEVAERGIRVVAVAPGLIATDLHATTGDPERVERMAPQIPLGRAGQPEEIAEAVAWLMSERASYVTATTLRVTGGRWNQATVVPSSQAVQDHHCTRTAPSVARVVGPRTWRLRVPQARQRRTRRCPGSPSGSAASASRSAGDNIRSTAGLRWVSRRRAECSSARSRQWSRLRRSGAVHGADVAQVERHRAWLLVEAGVDRGAEQGRGGDVEVAADDDQADATLDLGGDGELESG